MNDPRRLEQTRASRSGGDPTDRLRQQYAPYDDPAYSGYSPYSPPYYQGPRYGPNATQLNPTEKLPQYWMQDQAGPEPLSAPDRPKPPRWLWIIAGAALLLVAALVIALVLANDSAKKQPTIAPLPGAPDKPATSRTAPSATTSAPGGSTTAAPSETTSADGTDSVVYQVNGDGRAISITYVDTGGVLQTEFNVELPWSKEVRLAKDDRNPNVTIVNIGSDVTCTVTVAGAQVRERTGAGLTICDAPS